LNQNQNVFLLDAGGTFLKGAVLQAGGLSTIHREAMPPMLENEPGAKEIDPKDLTSRLELLILKMTSEFGPPSNLRLTGQMGGLVLLDLDGKPLSGVRSWQDTRTLIPRQGNISSWDRFRTEYLDEFSAASGNDIKPSTSIVQLLDQLSVKPVSEPFRAMSLLGYIANHLAGSLNNPTIHASDAAATGMFDIFGSDFNLDGIGRISKFATMPVVQKAYAPIEGGSNSDYIVMAGVGDQQASLFGVDLDNNSIAVNVGTGGQVAMLTPQSARSPQLGIQIRPYFLESRIGTITHLPAGRIISRVVSELFGSNHPDTFRKFFSQSASIGGHDPIDLYDLDLKGLDKVEPDTMRIARSVLNELVNKYGSAINHLDPLGKRKIIFAGGLGQRFTQFSDALSLRSGRDKLISKQPETSLAGLAKLEIGN
jgi:sugar (pentulose or hexulose) kinase